ncbi:hypothetical protein AAE026_13115 [Bradyrhizobium sp. DN5]|uniref:hypothetical protein n=1 Tax=Bradyrhizobium sp. DN5 TaxID=3056950 RepID=UPI0035245476
MDETGHIANRIDLDCPDDEAAKERAKSLPRENGLELWLFDRCIAVFKADCHDQQQDAADKLEKLLKDAEDCTLLSKLAADPAKRERFAKLSARFREMAEKLEAARAKADTEEPIAPG